MNDLFDYELLMLNCFNDRALAYSMAELFVEGLPNDIMDLKNFFHADEREKLRFLLHRMKSGTLTMGALEVTNFTAHLEKQVMTVTPLSELATLFDDLFNKLGLLRRAIASEFDLPL